MLISRNEHITLLLVVEQCLDGHEQAFMSGNTKPLSTGAENFQQSTVDSFNRSTQGDSFLGDFVMLRITQSR
ncbi:hypothetical protein WS96_31190 [Burkholderia sp. MSMB1835]|nr:hypothetical protein WS96_31190 [Burkholderia sp. MSMB1835]